MATEFARINGSYSTAYIGRYDLLSQSTSGNYSRFRLYGIFYYGGGTSVGSSYSTFTLHTSTIKTGSYRYYSGETQLGYVDINIAHNPDGSFPSTYIGISANSYHINGNAGGYLSAPKINRYANITEANNFNDEQNPVFNFTNPANYWLTFKLEVNGNTDFIKRENVANASSPYTLQLTDEERTKLRQAAANTNSLGVRFTIGTSINGSIANWSYSDRTMSITNANPIFTDFEYEDVETKTTSLTGNPFAIIKGYSEVYVGISTSKKATAQKYATMSKYRVKIGEASLDIPYSDTLKVGGRIQNANDSVISCSAIDSRNNATTVSKTIENFIEYNPLTKGSISVERENGVSEDVTLKFDGTFHNINFGSVTNTIKSATYVYKTTDSSEWSDPQELDISISLDNETGNYYFEGLIEGDTETKGFDIGNSYNFQVSIEDELSLVTFTANLGSGVPHLAFSKNGVGIMGKYDDKEGGLLQIAGKQVLMYDIVEEWEEKT